MLARSKEEIYDIVDRAVAELRDALSHPALNINERLELAFRTISHLTHPDSQLEEYFKETMAGFARTLEAKDSYTAGHSERVRIFTSMIADGMAIHGEEREKIIQGSLLHDVGKLCVDLSTLNNPGRLLPEQIELFRSHPTLGKKILEPISFLQDFIPMVEHHHENYDGSGYPDGIHGDLIPIGARIIAVADSYDAMTSHRIYRRALGHELAIEELKRFSGTQFDPHVVDIFIIEVEKNLSELGLTDLTL